MRKPTLILAALLWTAWASPLIAGNGKAAFANVSGGLNGEMFFVYLESEIPSDLTLQKFDVELTNVDDDFSGTIKMKNNNSGSIKIYDAAQDGTEVADTQDYEITVSDGEIESGQTTKFYVQAVSDVSSASITVQLHDSDGDPVMETPASLAVYVLPVLITEVVEDGETEDCTGYDPDNGYLMVPMEGSNKIGVEITGAPASFLQLVKIIGSGESLTVDPEVPPSANEEIELSGTSPALGVDVKLEYNENSKVIFKADVLPKKSVTLNIRKVKNSNVAGEVIACPTKGEIDTYMETFRHQANVFITALEPTDFTINYDTSSPYGALMTWVRTTYGFTFTEMTAIYEQSAPTVDTDIYIVKKLDPDGEGLWIRDPGVITMKDDPSPSALYVMAHEIGHSLGRLDHNDLNADYLMHEAEGSGHKLRIPFEDWRKMN